MSEGAGRGFTPALPAPFYRDAGIVIYHGDCRDILPSLPSESVDFTCTDAPYGVAFRGRFDRKHAPIAGDEDLSWVEPVYREVFRVMKPDRLAVFFYGWPHAETFLSAWKQVGFRPVSHLCFIKNMPGLGRFTRNRHETAFLVAKGHPAPPEKAIADTIEWQREDDAFHPNQKPLAVITQLLAVYAPEGGLVLDPFLGSGTTLRAAKDLGHSAIGVEIQKDYCERAARRLAQGVLPLWELKTSRPITSDLFGE
jgi:site-specific DNA-methyltransferase (adenine-specific)